MNSPETPATPQADKPEHALATAYNVLMEAASFIVDEGTQLARQDDPHRFATLPAEFDGGKAMRQLQINYMAGGKVQIRQLLIGTKGGEQKIVLLFSTTLQGPVEGGVH